MKVFINKSQVKQNTGKASLITLPHTNNKRVWIPNSFIYTKNSYLMAVYLPEDCNFIVISGVKGKHRESINGANLAHYFEATKAPDTNSVEVHKPKKLTIKEVKIDESLKRLKR